MSNTTLSFPGALNNNTGTYDQNNALFLKVFSGEVLKAFAETNIMRERHLVRTITHGKSASFPATWKATARYHVPGNPILGANQMNHAERIISIDDLLISDVTIYQLDEAKIHYDVRSIYSTELGNALANEFDKRCLQTVGKAARATSVLTGTPTPPGGTQVAHADMATDGERIAASIYKVAEKFAEKDVPMDGRTCVLAPVQFYLMAQTTKIMNRDWGGRGSYADGTLPPVGGIDIVMSNHLPTTNLGTTRNTGENNDYNDDFSKTVGLIFRKDAIGTVKLNDLVVEEAGQTFEVMYQASLIIGKYAMGHGILRPECAAELMTT